MPFPIILWEDKESLNFAHQFFFQLHSHRFCIGNLTRFATLSLAISPHLLMLLYHVLSMKYFEDVALFIPT